MSLLLVRAQRDVALIVRSSCFRLTNFVGHARAAVVPWAFSDAAGVAGGLVIHFDVDLGAESTMMMDHDIHTREPMTAPSEP